MLGRLAAAYAGVGEVLLLKGDTTALYAAGYVLKLVLALAVAAPHSLDKAGLVLGGVDKLLIACGCEGLFLSILKGAVIHILMDSNEQLFDVFTKSVEGYKRLFASIAADNYALVLFDILRADFNSYGHALHLVLRELPAGSVITVVKLYSKALFELVLKGVSLVEHALLMLGDGDNRNLNGRDLRRQNKSVVVAVNHNQRAYHTG